MTTTPYISCWGKLRLEWFFRICRANYFYQSWPERKLKNGSRVTRDGKFFLQCKWFYLFITRQTDRHQDEVTQDRGQTSAVQWPRPGPAVEHDRLTDLDLGPSTPPVQSAGLTLPLRQMASLAGPEPELLDLEQNHGGSWGGISSCSWNLDSYNIIDNFVFRPPSTPIFSEISSPCTTCWGCRRMFSFIS